MELRCSLYVVRIPRHKRNLRGDQLRRRVASQFTSITVDTTMTSLT